MRQLSNTLAEVASLDEIVAARDAARRFGALMERLRAGDATRYIIFFRNRPQAVLLHINEYERLLVAAGEVERQAAA
jgi:hypothetical protein